ncbi:discoidin domain-containing protein [Flavivirga spongiicola]|uniref:Discoidin domain-containing protein n=1 Tax=Flavivirga spongiicola TaxID=421621 RepID=A0ABU7XXS5_9FLAO|nr:discoidin domain-containing protein [Flavivirga sp. MEBiC05379]MDO5980235.1 discoidin domain-containing protein [Flavivirga sp. MEBiC05379]
MNLKHSIIVGIKKMTWLLVVSTLLTVSCSKDNDVTDPVVEEPDPTPEVDVWTVNKTNQYALNVVFFKPADFNADATLINQVSDVMLFIQKWYEKQMELQGFGKKTFGLITNQHDKVRVHLVEGKQPSSFYDGHSEIVNEIDQYFVSNPGYKSGKHIFVLGQRDSGVPFYGIGKTAFATSENFSLTTTGKSVGDLELKNCHLLGGIMHELGHGLNLPHCAHKASDLPKVSLMSFGNHTYQEGKEDLVFLTKSDCAILNVSEVFNTKDKQYYNTEPTVTMEEYSVKKDATKQATIVQGLFTSDVKANHIYVGHNGYPLEGGYDNITFTTTVAETSNTNEYSFYLEMPYSDIFNGYQAKDLLELSMVVVTENGNKNIPVKYDYTIDVLSPEPNDDILKDYTPFVFSNRSSWTISANSTGPNRAAIDMIDGQYSTYWHSSWQYVIGTNGNHQVNIDINTPKDINGIYLHSDRPGTQYRPKHIIVETSSDKINWVVTKEMDIATIGSAREVFINFDNQVNARYIKLIVSEVHAGNAEENLIFSEVDIF